MSEVLVKILVYEQGKTVKLVFRFENHYLEMPFDLGREDLAHVRLKLELFARKLTDLEYDTRTHDKEDYDEG